MSARKSGRYELPSSACAASVLTINRIKAATAATLVTDLAVHPAETLITRIQSPAYATRYKTARGTLNRSFFAGLYQGFGPTVLAGVPASAAFFTVYEGLKQNPQMSADDAPGRRRRRWGHTVGVARQFARHPGRLWAGYTALTLSLIHI